MKIQPITPFNLHHDCRSKTQSNNNGSNIELARTVLNLNNIPNYYPISFGGIQNSSKLRALFAYRLPCMYTGVIMIDPKLLNKWLKSHLFLRRSSDVIDTLLPFEESFVEMEGKVFQILKERSKIHPDWTIKQLLEELKPVYCRRLRKRQAPIFHELDEGFKTLPPIYKNKFNALMEDTEKKLNERPVIIPFSSYEFKYKLEKINIDISRGQSLKEKKVMKKLLKESKRFSNTTSANTIEHQKNVLQFMKLVLRKSVLKNDERLKELMETAQSRLNKDEIVVSFSRKNFIYDVIKIIEDIPNPKIQEKIIEIASKLPTSKESTSAYIMKLLTEPSEKIGHRLVWPSLASVEHIYPRSCGGLDLMENFGGATTRANSDRKSIEFTQQMKKVPTTAQCCQMYVDRLIELYKEGIFYKIGLSPRYITDFKKTIYEQSKHRIVLDTSKL